MRQPHESPHPARPATPQATVLPRVRPKSLVAEIRLWFAENTFPPAWLPRSVRHPLTAYALAVGVELVAVLLTVPVLALFPDFSFRDAIIILGVVCVALTLGGGPGLLASFTGTFLLEFALLPPVLSFSLTKRSDMVGVLFYLCVCLATNMAASHRTRIRHGLAR